MSKLRLALISFNLLERFVGLFKREKNIQEKAGQDVLLQSFKNKAKEPVKLARILSKPNARFPEFSPHMYVLFPILAETFGKHGVDYCMITSANDSNHKFESKHYQNLAWDLRSHHLPSADARMRLHEDLKLELLKISPNYRLLFENGGQPSEHWHLGYYG